MPFTTFAYLITLPAPASRLADSSDDFGFSVFDFGFFDQRIIRSALAKRLGGIVNPICLAVFRLITNSSFFGCSTRTSATLAGLGIGLHAQPDVVDL
jgi:hypothetical protein